MILIVLVCAAETWTRTDKTFLYNDNSEDWEPGPTLPSPRSEHCVASLDSINRKYIFVGGFAGVSWADNTVEIYDWIDSTWTTQPPMPQGHSATKCDTVTLSSGSTVLVVAGGKSGGTMTDSVLFLDIDTLAWTNGPALPVATQLGSSLTILGRHFLMGGRTAAGNVFDTYELKLDASAWEARPSLSTYHPTIDNQIAMPALYYP